MTLGECLQLSDPVPSSGKQGYQHLPKDGVARLSQDMPRAQGESLGRERFKHRPGMQREELRNPEPPTAPPTVPTRQCPVLGAILLGTRPPGSSSARSQVRGSCCPGPWSREYKLPCRRATWVPQFMEGSTVRCAGAPFWYLLFFSYLIAL